MMRATIATVGGDVPRGDGAARQPILRRDGVLVTLRDADGVAGVGEASPLPGWSADTLVAARTELLAWRPPTLDGGAGATALLEQATRGVRAPSARFAIETAVLDWLGRRTGQPAHRLLARRAPRGALPLSFLLAPGDAVERARALRAHGVRHVKLKVGADVDGELRVLRALRAAVPDAEIRLDANRTLPDADVLRLTRAYGDAGVAVLEEPCAPTALLGMPRLPVPVALDESLAGDDATRLVDAVARAQPLAAVVLKPTALGGIRRCLALAAAAEAVGAAAIVTHTFDGPIAMAAAAELALALPNARVAGLAPHAALAAYPRRVAAALGETAVVPHDAPGLGLREAS